VTPRGPSAKVSAVGRFLTGLPGALASRVLGSRNRLPRWVNRSIDYVADHPESLPGRLAALSLGRISDADIPPPTTVPDTPVRVYIGPTNYAAQGHAWARALDAASPRVGARNMAVEVPGGFAFDADTEVPVAVYHRSRRWQTDELDAVGRFTHVLFEAGRPLFGRLLGRSIEREVAELASRGISTAFMCHGTDVRLPSSHIRRTPWSPYSDPDLYVDRLERLARRYADQLDRFDRPIFVSTPDLLADVPRATWCPVVVDAARWSRPRRTVRGRIPVVAHVPSNGAVKGTTLVRPAMERLAADGIIEYREIHGVPSRAMPDVWAEADIVLDQFRLGSYGVAACEAMAAGSVVVGHVLEETRAVVARDTGTELPVVEATPDTVEGVVRALAEDPSRREVLTTAGREFVAHAHDGRLSSRVLLDHWIEAT